MTLLLVTGFLPARADDPVPNPTLPKDATVSLGALVTFQASATTTNPPLTFQWQHQGTNLDGATLSALRLTNVTELDAGGYQAIIWNASGNSATSRVAQLTVDRTFIKITTGPVVTDVERSIGASWFDYDNDGDVDFFVAVFSGGPCSLYQNNGDGTFTKVTNALTSSLMADAITAPIADFDNDGLLDLFLVRQNAAQNQLFRNTGNGSWAKLPANTFDSICTGSSDAAWVDYDRDGFVDLFTQNGYNLNRDDALYRNLGNGTFHKVSSAEVGLGNDGAGAGGCAWSDYDNDGWPDVFLAQGIIRPNGSVAEARALFHNDGHGGFSRVADTFVGIPANCDVWVPSWIDCDSDGLPDLFLNAWDYSSNRQFALLCRNLGNGTFAEVLDTGIVLGQYSVNGETSAWGDYDNDGFIDLLTLTSSRSMGTGFLYRNQGDGTFQSVDIGSPLVDGTLRQNVTWADYNNDGFLDLLLSCNTTSGTGERNHLYQNNGPRAGNTNHWLKVKLNSLVSNRAAIGAKVRVQATIAGTPRSQLREISGNFGLFSAREGPSLIAHFGLGDATNIDLVRIEWPSGNVQELTNVTTNQLLRVTEQTFITPARPSVSLNGSVTLTRAAVSGATYQWQFDGTDLIGQTNRTLNLTNVVADQEGRYSVVVSNVSMLVTNYVSLHVDTTFTKITEGPVVTDRANFLLGTWADYDDDGFNDLLVPAGTDVAGQAPVFYHNLGGTNFVRLTTNEVGAVVGRRPYCFQGLWADFNNDNHLDLLEIGGPASGNGSSNRFFLGRPDHTLEWITADIGINPPVGSWQCSLVDYDNDGAVDVYYTSGWVQTQSRDRLYRNRGDGTFVHAWSPTGPIGDTQYGCWSDYDNDGDMDLWLGVYGSLAQFYRNNGDGTFSGNLAGTEIPRTTSFYGTWGDYDNDGYQDFLTMTALFHNTRNGSFTNVASFPEGAGHWGDYDNDGDLDFVKGYWNQQPCVFYRNDGGGVFTRVDLGSPSRDVPANESLQTWGDYNNDGFLDLFVGTRGNPSGANFLYRNSGLAGGNTNHWLIVKPRGTTSNRSAIGAKVRVQARIRGTATWQLREIQGNYFDDLRAHFGLGNATNITALRIEWPSGTVQELTNVAPEQILEVIEPRRPVLALLALSPSRVDGSLQADPALAYVIEASDDLASWTVLATVTTDASGVATWSDTSSPLAAHRYYKASRSVP
jgi:hypothetical protein